MTDAIMKTCTKCGVAKGLECFGKLKARCKPCRVEDSREYAILNRVKVNEASAKWRKKNPEKRRRISKAWRTKRPDLVRAHEDRYRAAHADEVRERKKKYRDNNKEKIAEYRKKTRDQIRKRERDIYARDPSKFAQKNAKKVADLSDAYVANLIAKGQFSARLVPDALVEAKRISLLIDRLIRKRNQT